jgi:peptidoglycan/xylan/chitin deacetylase (PgdA/CDA1 family)
MPVDRLAGRLGRLATAAADRVAAPRVSILIFHRVLPEPDPLFPGEVCAAQFHRLMGTVARAFTVLSLGQSHALWLQQRLPPRALVVTFDDGYADNASVALPVLQRHGLVATFFVATGFLDGGRMWNDTVIECLRRCALPVVDLAPFGLGRFPLGGPAERRAAIEALLPRIKYLDLAGRERAITQLQASCGHPELPRDLMMTSAQVQQLHQAGMEIGGHTVMHPILTELPDDQAAHEMAAGRARLQQITGAAVDVFAYPNGKPGRDYGPQHVALARQAGFRCAVSTAPGVAGAGSDPLQWPRFTPWDRSPPAFMARLLWARYRSGAGAVAQARFA